MKLLLLWIKSSTVSYIDKCFFLHLHIKTAITKGDPRTHFPTYHGIRSDPIARKVTAASARVQRSGNYCSLRHTSLRLCLCLAHSVMVANETQFHSRTHCEPCDILTCFYYYISPFHISTYWPLPSSLFCMTLLCLTQIFRQQSRQYMNNIAFPSRQFFHHNSQN